MPQPDPIAVRARSPGRSAPRCVLAGTALVALLGGPGFDLPAAAAPASASPADSTWSVQDLIVAATWSMQDKGELQFTGASDHDVRDGTWANGLGLEYGVTNALEVGLAHAFAQGGTAAAWEAEAVYSPRHALAFGVDHAWTTGPAAEATNDLFVLGGFARPSLQLHLDADLELAPGLTHGAWGAAAVRPFGRWAALLEAGHDADQDATLRLSPGVAFHPAEGFELAAGVPLGVGGGRTSVGVALRLSAEAELAP